jgi:DNA-binding MltR family transcriptional regulator
MSRRKAKPKDRAAPLTTWGLAQEWEPMMAELAGESDRGVALIGAAYLDTALGSLLRRCFAGDREIVAKLLDSPEAPLGTFASRINMAYCLGHIGPHHYGALNAIRDIRNAFAHFRRPLTFEDDEIKGIITGRLRPASSPASKPSPR